VYLLNSMKIFYIE